MSLFGRRGSGDMRRWECRSKRLMVGTDETNESIGGEQLVIEFHCYTVSWLCGQMAKIVKSNEIVGWCCTFKQSS